MERKKKPQNMIGANLRRIRNQRGLSQEALATKFQLAGFDISRATLSKIEAQIRCVTDMELFEISKILKINSDALLKRG